MCAIFGCGPTVVSREKGGTDTLTAGMNGYRITSIYGGSATKRIVINEPSLRDTGFESPFVLFGS